MLTSNSRVKSLQRTLFKSFTRANIGPSKEEVGGFGHAGCSKETLKNFQRDLKAYIKDYDACMFVENLKTKGDFNKSFYFEYVLDDERLKHVFSSNDISRRNCAFIWR